MILYQVWRKIQNSLKGNITKTGVKNGINRLKRSVKNFFMNKESLNSWHIVFVLFRHFYLKEKSWIPMNAKYSISLV